MRHLFPHWYRHFDGWFAPFAQGFHHKTRQKWASLYVQGLCSPAHRKSLQPLADVVAPGKADHLQHFITDSPWSVQRAEQLIAERAEQLVGGKDAVLIIDDTCLSKFGTHSVGVARQYSGQVGKITNCQCLVSLTLAKAEIPVPVALRLFLPQEWTSDVTRCLAARIPEEHQHTSPKWALALQELDRLRPTLTFGVVLADAGYGVNRRFRQELSKRNLLWSVGITRNAQAYPEHVGLIPIPKIYRGRRPKLPTPTEDPETVEAMLTKVPWQHVVWRQGTKGPLTGKFARLRVRLADGDEDWHGSHLPGEMVWIIGEERREGCKYYACNLPQTASLQELIEVTKKRWACEEGHRELKQEVGLNHFEGRFWTGLCHHVVLCLIALLFLQGLRVTQPEGLHGRTVPAIRAEVAKAVHLPICCSNCPAGKVLCNSP